MPEPAGWDYFDVAADVGVRAWGPTLGDAFAQAALGVLALSVAPAEVEEREAREVRAQGDAPETRLVNWINECLYVHEIEGFAVHRVETARLDGAAVHGILHGEPIDPHRHRLGTVVKAATLHDVAVTEGVGRAEVRLIVDV
ncbi:MAG: archease [Candidatus Rokubacteria bacterium]|nr:archease [Candidatus Rokubacteria bacterium]